MARQVLTTPRFRGVLHEWAFFASLPMGSWLIATTPVQWLGSVAIFIASLWGVLGISSAYHRYPWGPRTRRWMRRLDHSMIFGLIAGTYTPFAVIACSSALAHDVLVLVWCLAGAGVLAKLLWIDAPDWVASLGYVAVGWQLLIVFPEVAASTGPLVTSLLVVGGISYTVGGIIFALHRPDPFPDTFGYHEIFHGCTLVGAGAHYIAVVLLVT